MCVLSIDSVHSVHSVVLAYISLKSHFVRDFLSIRLDSFVRVLAVSIGSLGLTLYLSYG